MLGVAILTSALAFAGHAVAAPLAQAGTGTITGQVLSLDDVPLPNVQLAAFAQAPGTPNRTQLGAFQSDAQGRYSAQVPAGTVWMEFLTQDIAGQSFWGYDNLPVNVAAGETVTGQDFRVAIRIVSEPQAPAPLPPANPVVLPGMPTTGSAPNPLLPLAAGLALLLTLSGLALRRRAAR
jgi:LPXTG-motif cell wall-anchored protein